MELFRKCKKKLSSLWKVGFFSTLKTVNWKSVDKQNEKISNRNYLKNWVIFFRKYFTVFCFTIFLVLYSVTYYVKFSLQWYWPFRNLLWWINAELREAVSARMEKKFLFLIRFVGRKDLQPSYNSFVVCINQFEEEFKVKNSRLINSLKPVLSGLPK